MTEYVIDATDALLGDGFDARAFFGPRLREEIVRCKDCANYREHVNGCVEFGDEAHGEYENVEPDGFCAWAVRREQ